jgi:hypothetical protein
MAMKKRRSSRTLLIVGEGYCEVALLKHIRQFPGVRGLGVQITIRNAHGKGAAHVVDTAARLMANAEYDQVAVLLDTDTDWNEAVAASARHKGIQVLASDPCLEAVLLRGLGQKLKAKKYLKRQFQEHVGSEGTNPGDYHSHFNQEQLDQARHREAVINSLLKLFGI